jgi:hypothetical protein
MLVSTPLLLAVAVVAVAVMAAAAAAGAAAEVLLLLLVPVSPLRDNDDNAVTTGAAVTTDVAAGAGEGGPGGGGGNLPGAALFGCCCAVPVARGGTGGKLVMSGPAAVAGIGAGCVLPRGTTPVRSKIVSSDADSMRRMRQRRRCRIGTTRRRGRAGASGFSVWVASYTNTTAVGSR